MNGNGILSRKEGLRCSPFLERKMKKGSGFDYNCRQKYSTRARKRRTEL
jgi:hypothetical protein